MANKLSGKICKRCKARRSLRTYRQKVMPDGVQVRVDTCKVCEAKDNTKALDAEIEERHIERAAKPVREKKKKQAVRNKKANARRKEFKAKAVERVAKEQAALAVNKSLSGAEREIAQRALCRRKLLPFIRKFNKNYDAGWVHSDICTRLEKFVKAVERGEAPRLMLFMPPRHGKSEIASKNLPAWMLGQHPEWEIIAASYAVSLPIGFSRKVQALIQDDYYKKLFPDTRLHPKSQSAEAWMTTAEGGYVAAGVGGGITGKGAHVFIIDDPVKDAQEADSDTQRQSVWDWWGSTAKTRLAPGGGVLVIQTRWHDDDLSGRLLLQMKELKEEFAELIEDAERRGDDEDLKNFQKEMDEIDNWEVVSYPAIAVNDEFITNSGAIIYETDNSPTTRQVRAKGDALHHSRYPLSRLRNMKRSMQPRHWSALYQQNPVPDEGIYFTKDMLKFTNSVPPQAEMYIFQTWDLAIGEKQSNDYTVGVCGALDWQGQTHVLEVVRFRRSDTQFIAEAVLNFEKKYVNVMQIGIEKGALELALWPTLKKEMKKRKQFPTFNHDLRPITDKWVRARPLQGRMQQGMVLFPFNQPWVDIAVQELLRFPGGLHDDIVDALAWLLRVIVEKKEPQKPGEVSRRRKGEKTVEEKLKAILAQQHQSGSYMGA